MNLLIKPEWRGVFQMYPFDFKRKEGCLNILSLLLRHFTKEPIVFNGFFLFLQQVQKLTANKTANKISPRQSFRGAFAP